MNCYQSAFSKRFFCFTAAACFLALQLFCADAPRPQLVGVYGSMDKVTLDGNDTFHGDTIKRALLRDPDFLFATHELNSFEAYLSLLQEKILAGYRKHGFPDAAVEVVFNGVDQKVQVVVSEGVRYLSSKAFISGLDAKLADALRSELCEGEKTPSWCEGKPADFSARARSRLKARITGLLKQHHLFFPEFSVDVVKTPEKRAELVVAFTDAGIRGTIGAICIEGNEINKKEELLKLLSLKPGLPVTQELIDRVHTTLRESGRFLSVSVTPVETVEKKGSLDLAVKLVENKKLPPLTEALTAEDNAFLKLRQRFLSAREKHDDIVITMVDGGTPLLSGRRITVIFSHAGWLLTVTSSESSEASLPEMLFLVDREKMVYRSPFRQSKLQSMNSTLRVIITITLSATPEGNSFSLGGGITTDRTPSDDPLSFNLSLNPAGFIELARLETLGCRIEENRLVGRSKTAHMSFNAATGGDLKVRFFEGDKETSISCTFEKGAFAKAYEEFVPSIKSCENVYEKERPLTSVLCYLLHDARSLWALFPEKELSVDKNRVAAIMELLQQWLAADALSPLDKAAAGLSKEKQQPDARFSLPVSIGSAEKLPAMLAAFIASACNDLFRAGSWPWTVSREVACVLNGRSRYTGQVLQKLFESKEMGPIGFLTVSKLLSFINPHFSRMFASRGLFTLSLDGFKKDYRLLFHDGTYLSAILKKWLGYVKTLDDDALNRFAAHLPEPYSEAIKKIRKRLDQSETVELENLLPPILDALWEKTLRDTIEAALASLKSPTY